MLVDNARARYSKGVNLLEHKKARLTYEVLEEFEAGIELLGGEVKALRQALGKLEGAHIIVRNGEAYLVGASIPPYQPANTKEAYDPERTRKLLITKKELAQLAAVEGQKGLTIVPLVVYTKGRNLKVRIAAVRGRKQHDKRALLKKRDTEREIRRTLKKEQQ